MNPRCLKDWQEAGYMIGPDGRTLLKRTSPAAPSLAGQLAEFRDENAGTTRKRVDRAPVLLRSTPVPNATEQRFLDHFEALWKPAFVKFQPAKLATPGGTIYTPDWLFHWPGGRDLFIEVKAEWKTGRKRVQNERSPEVFKAIRAAFPCWRFCWAQLTADGRWRLAGEHPLLPSP